MTDFTATRLGVKDGAAAASGNEYARELFLKLYGGEVMTAFAENNVMADKHFVRTISAGKSAQFPATWKTDAAYHVPGTQLTGSQSVAGNERVIHVDGFLISDIFVAEIDELVSHMDLRMVYSQEQGRALARKYDQNVFQTAVLAARASATVTGGNGGSALTNASYATDGDVLAGGIFDCAQTFDEKDVPEEDRYVAFRPAQYYLLAQTTKVINRDWGGAGVYAEGSVLKVAGVHIIKSNNVPSTNVGAGGYTAGVVFNTYSGDFSTTVGVAFNKMAVGTVKLVDLSMQSEYQITRQGTIMVARYAMGHGILRPDCAIELKTA